MEYYMTQNASIKTPQPPTKRCNNAQAVCAAAVALVATPCSVVYCPNAVATPYDRLVLCLRTDDANQREEHKPHMSSLDRSGWDCFGNTSPS
jgi:hypothetical protein